jgi:hypothetical protein
VSLSGQANGRPYEQTIDWSGGTLRSSNADLRFDLGAGTVDGQANGQNVSLRYEPVSGRLQGTLNGAAFDVTVVNRGLDQVLADFYLFAPAA